ncbi:MAG TPA: RluA family pseudouridine synthase [Devosia sp.]|jgi:tRNA pseudouridine32 synthase/23S rRNA pseudouridine746 synthase|nr:RluA family pseudouridine synthase [Devosia sp.]
MPPLPPTFDYRPPPGLDIVYEDERLIVCNKPTGLLTVPGKDPSLADCLEARVQARRPDRPHAKVVHRLDKDTSGLLLLAFDKKALGALGTQFEQRQVGKYYVARVWGELPQASGIVDLPLATDWENKPRQRVDHERGRPSRTEWEVLAREPEEVTRVKLVPLTGRTHQLRVHMLALGHPILGDSFYASGEALAAADRLQLHAEMLAFAHPDDGRRLEFIAPAPF